MPKVELDAIKESNRTGYPAPFDADVAGRWYRRLARVTGIEDFDASLVQLEPGAWSSQRHWHAGEDELLVMIEGEAVLVEDDARTLLGPGDVAAWAKGVANGHHLINESAAPAASSSSAAARARGTATIPTSTSSPTASPTTISTRTARLIERSG